MLLLIAHPLTDINHVLFCRHLCCDREVASTHRRTPQQLSSLIEVARFLINAGNALCEQQLQILKFEARQKSCVCASLPFCSTL